MRIKKWVAAGHLWYTITLKAPGEVMNKDFVIKNRVKGSFYEKSQMSQYLLPCCRGGNVYSNTNDFQSFSSSSLLGLEPFECDCLA